MTHSNWEAELGTMLAELSAIQQQLLEFLKEKGRVLAQADAPQLAAMHERELDLLARLQACRDRRAEMLRRAEHEGLPADSLRSLSRAAGSLDPKPLERQFQHAAAQRRLLQHQSLTNWLATQSTLLHLAQLLEIIGTGGRPSPTYGKGESRASGALVDRAA